MSDHPNSDRVMETIRVSGRVHGVGFRAFAKTLALRFGVTGTVENCPDGTVLLEACGFPDTIEPFVKELWKGPSSLSRVDRIDRVRRPISDPIPVCFEIRAS